MFGLVSVEKALHNLEQELAAIQACGEPFSSLEPRAEAISGQFEKVLEENAEIFGEIGAGRQTKRQVSLGQLMDFQKQLARSKGANSDLAAQFENLFIARPLEEIFRPFEDLARQVANRHKKELLRLQIEGDLRIAPESYQELLDSLGHVFRNIVDHGIESPEEREASGKKRAGQIRVRGRETESGWIEISIDDDGRGIQEDKLREKLSSLNISVGGREELLHAIFLPEVSTAREVSLTSGRGIGLAAVKEAVERCGGRISVRSELGRGVTFVLSLPLLHGVLAG